MQFRTTVDMQYGVKTLDSAGLLKIANTLPVPAALRFNGMPVSFADNVTHYRKKVKKWKRLNRPAKVKITEKSEPGMYVMNIGNVQHLVVHRSLEESFRHQIGKF